MIWSLIIASGGFAVAYNIVKSKLGKITSRGNMIKNVIKMFLTTALILIGGYLAINLIF